MSSSEAGTPQDVPPPIRIDVQSAVPVAYPVHIGEALLDQLPSIATRTAAAHRYALIADDQVARLFGGHVQRAFSEHGIEIALFTFPAGEKSKVRDTWRNLTDEMIAAGFGRDACVIALGGGVTGDLAGFVAATYMRGVPFVQVPTTLLAMVDASVGGKVGVDVPGGKNLVGAFLQPVAVVADTTLLQTLAETDFRSGLAEAVKHAFIADGAHLDWIEENTDAILRRDPGALSTLVRRSVAIKAGIVASDPFERGERAILNFGHTIGHALERVSGYRMPHGFAVAAGMVVESQIGHAARITAAGTAERLLRLLARLGIPVTAPDLDLDAVLDSTRMDKKGRASRVRYALVARPGVPARGPAGEWTFEVDTDIVRAALETVHVALSHENTDV